MPEKLNKLQEIVKNAPNELTEKLVNFSFKEQFIWLPACFFICTVLFFFLTLTTLNALILIRSLFICITLFYPILYRSFIKKTDPKRDKWQFYGLFIFLLVLDFCLLFPLCPFVQDLVNIFRIFLSPIKNWINEHLNFSPSGDFIATSVTLFASGASILALIQVSWLKRSLEFDQYRFQDYLKEITNVLDDVDLNSPSSYFYFLCLVPTPGLPPINYKVTSGTLDEFQKFIRAFDSVMASPNCKKEIAMLKTNEDDSHELTFPPENSTDPNILTPFLTYWSNWIHEAWGLDKNTIMKILSDIQYHGLSIDVQNEVWERLAYEEGVLITGKPLETLGDVIKLIDTTYRKLFVNNKYKVDKCNDYNVKINYIKALQHDSDKEKLGFVNLFISKNKAFIAFTSQKHDKTFQIVGIKITNKNMLAFMPHLFDAICNWEIFKDSKNPIYLKNVVSVKKANGAPKSGI
jgi:hypothetical protein